MIVPHWALTFPTTVASHFNDLYCSDSWRGCIELEKLFVWGNSFLCNGNLEYISIKYDHVITVEHF